MSTWEQGFDDGWNAAMQRVLAYHTAFSEKLELIAAVGEDAA